MPPPPAQEVWLHQGRHATLQVPRLRQEDYRQHPRQELKSRGKRSRSKLHLWRLFSRGGCIEISVARMEAEEGGGEAGGELADAGVVGLYGFVVALPLDGD